MLGLTFKEDCPDLRNTRVVDVIEELGRLGAQVDIHDPWVDADEAKREYGVDMIAKPEAGAYDSIILAVGHRQFRAMGAVAMRRFGKDPHILYDVKYVLPAAESDGRL